MSSPRALLRVLRRRSPARPQGGDVNAVSWGRIGAYEGVSRAGILHLVAPDAGRSGLGVKPGA